MYIIKDVSIIIIIQISAFLNAGIFNYKMTNIFYILIKKQANKHSNIKYLANHQYRLV